MKIVYYSESGNTEKMANIITDGIVKGGKTAEVINQYEPEDNSSECIELE